MTKETRETVRIIREAMLKSDPKTASNIYAFAKGIDTMLPSVNKNSKEKKSNE